MKNVLIGGILGVIAYFFVFELLNLEGGTGWLIFFVLGILIIIFLTKLSKQKSESGQYNNLQRNINYNGISNDITKQDLLNELSNAEKEFDNSAFNILKEIIISGINKQHTEIIAMINSKGRTAREWIYSVIGNKAGDLLETGNYHVYRGTLDMVGQGLLEIFDKSYDLLIKMNAKDIDIDYANEQKATLRRNIKQIG